LLPTSPMGRAMFEGALSLGIPTFENRNGRMMEGDGGCSLVERGIRDGRRLSVFRSYTFPYMDRPNLTVLTQAMVTRLIIEGKRTTGVEIAYDGKVLRVGAGLEVVLSLGAINTPKVLMLSGIGDQTELQRLGIPLVQHLPGVGQNFQDHVLLMSCVWEHQQPEPVAQRAQAVLQWKSNSSLDTPDMLCVHGEGVFVSAETAKFNPPANSCSIVTGIVHPKSRGHIRLTGADPHDPVEIEANFLGDPDDLKAMIRSVEFCRELVNSASLHPFVKREVIPGGMKGKALENFVRDSVGTYWHQTCTAKMGRDSMSVVDAQLKVYGIENLRIADGSIMPRVTTGNTMAPCIIIGERAGELLRTAYKLSGVEAYSDQGAALRFVNAERLAGFPSGRLFLDSVEQALAAALVDGHAVRRPSLRKYRGGLSPARLRRVTELVLGKVEDELTLQEMAESAGLSMTHFSQMFRRSTGESPHQFVLRHRVERAKEMLRAAEARVLDVAVACGFKTQQHFARVFRRVCGASPTEYREEFLR